MGSGRRMAPRLPLETHFELFWALVARIALRWPLEAHFELFWQKNTCIFTWVGKGWVATSVYSYMGAVLGSGG